MGLADQFPRLTDFAANARAEGYEDGEIDNFVRGKFIKPAIDEGYSAQDVNDYLGVKTEKPSFMKEVVGETAKTVTRMGLAVGGALVGGTVGSAVLPGVGTYAGAASGAASGEALAEYLFDDKFSPRQIALQAALGLIPGLKFAGITSQAGRVAVRAGEGAVMGGTGMAASRLVEGEKPTPGEVLKGAMIGLALGGGFGAHEGRARAKPGEKAPAAETEPKLTPEQQARADAIGKEMDGLETLRQSPKGRDLLRQQLAQEDVKYQQQEQARQMVERDTAALEIDASAQRPAGAKVTPTDVRLAGQIQHPELAEVLPKTPEPKSDMAQFEALLADRELPGGGVIQARRTALPEPGPFGGPDFAERGAAIDEQLAAAEQRRQSPAGADLLRRQLTAEQIRAQRGGGGETPPTTQGQEPPVAPRAPETPVMPIAAKPAEVPATPEQAAPYFVVYKNKRFPVQSFEDASRKWSEVRDQSGVGSEEAAARGAGDIPIVDPTGEQVAHISYNGKVWPGAAWKSGLEPLYNPYPPDLAGVKPAAPMVEQTPAGAQTVLPGAEARSIPKGGLKPKAGQSEAPTALEQSTIPEKQLELGAQPEKPVDKMDLLRTKLEGMKKRPAQVTPEQLDMVKKLRDSADIPDEMRQLAKDAYDKISTPRQRLEDSELAASTYIRRKYVENDGPGIKIPKGMEEEFGGWKRFEKPGGRPLDEIAEDMHNDGLIPEPTLNALQEFKTTGRSRKELGGTEMDYYTEQKIREATSTEGPLEYKGKTYEAATREEGGKLRLKNDPDKVLTKNSEIVQVEQKAPVSPEAQHPVGVGESRGGESQAGPRTHFAPEGERFRSSGRDPSYASDSELMGLAQTLRNSEEWRALDTELATRIQNRRGRTNELTQIQTELLSHAPIKDLVKKGFGSEVGSAGKLDEGMAQIEADARAARTELYDRIGTKAKEAGKSLEDTAAEMGVEKHLFAQLKTENEAPAATAQKPFSPLEREMGKSAETPAIFDPIADAFKGSRLNTETTKKITDAALETYQSIGKKIDPDIPITIQLVRDLAEGVIPKELVEGKLGKYGLNFDHLGEGLLSTESSSGRLLNLMSQLKQRARDAGLDIPGFKDPPPTGWEYAGDLSRRWVNIWKGMLVTQVATAVRNLETQATRVGIDAIEKVVDAGIRQMLHVGAESERGLTPGFAKAIESWGSLLRSGKRQQAMEILNVFPKQRDRIFWQYASDINSASKEAPNIPAGKVASHLEAITKSAENSVDFANTLNRGQEFLVRKAAFRSKLADILGAKGQSIDSIDPRAIDPEDITKSVDHALDLTFAVTPTKGLGKWMMDLYRVAPPLSFIAPFPRFMWNSWKFFMDFSPVGFTKLLSEKERSAIAAGDTKTLSRAIMGTGMLGAAYMLRSSDMAGEKWYELEVGGKTIDTRPYNPFASYLFVADVAKKWKDGTLDKLGFKDMMQGILSANFRAGTGLFMLDKVGDILGGMISSEGVPDVSAREVKRAVGETVAGFLTPLQTIRDILSDERLMSFGSGAAEDFANQEAKSRDVNETPFWGPMQAKIPGMSQDLPERQFPLGRQEGKEEPAFRQLTGIILRDKTPAQKEADRLGFTQPDLMHPTGISVLDRMTAEKMRPVAERTLTALINNSQYQSASDLQKRIWYKKWIGTLANDARRSVLAQDRSLRIEYVIKQAGKDGGKLLRQTYERAGILPAQQ